MFTGCALLLQKSYSCSELKYGAFVCVYSLCVHRMRFTVRERMWKPPLLHTLCTLIFTDQIWSPPSLPLKVCLLFILDPWASSLSLYTIPSLLLSLSLHFVNFKPSPGVSTRIFLFRSVSIRLPAAFSWLVVVSQEVRGRAVTPGWTLLVRWNRRPRGERSRQVAR